MRAPLVVASLSGVLLAVPGAGAEDARAPVGPESVSAAPEAPLQTITEDFRISKVAPLLQLQHTSTNTLWNFSGGAHFQLYREGDALAAFTLFEAAPQTPVFSVGRWANFGQPALFGLGGPQVAQFQVHVAHVGDAPLVMVENLSSQVVGRNLLRIKNNGPATFRFENQAAVTAGQAGAIWSFGQRTLGNQFFIATAGAPSLNLTMDPNGNMTIAGSLAQMSDRNSKHAIAPVDGSDVLTRLLALPLATWSYKGEASRHIGPMAQDFAAAFGFGSDDTHVAPSDVAGVGLAATQALVQQLAVANARLELLEQSLSRNQTEIADLRARLAASDVR